MHKPPAAACKTAKRKRSRRAAPPEQMAAMDTGVRTLDDVKKIKGKPWPAAQGEADYSVNALSKLLGKDRRTIDKALVGISPTRTEGKTKFYRLTDVEQAIRERSVKLKDEKVLEEIRKLRMVNDFEEGKLVLRSVVCESIRRCLSLMVAILEQRFVNELPTAAAGLDVPQLRIVAKRYLDDALVSCQELGKEWK